MSRFGSYRKINFEKVLTDLRTTELGTKVYERYEEYPLDEQNMTLIDLDYTTTSGIWNMRSTMQFHKKGKFIETIVLGLTDSLYQTSGVLDAWTKHTIDISNKPNRTVRPVFKYTMIGAVYTADLQLDNIVIDGNTYSFENTGDSFQTSSTSNTDYNNVTWSNVGVGTTTGVWNVDTAGTGSSGTGRTDASSGVYYVYAETSSPANVVGYTFWLRGPEITLSANPTFSYYEARNGTNLGTLDIYLDIIS